jgi:hypothetical protein
MKLEKLSATVAPQAPIVLQQIFLRQLNAHQGHMRQLVT